MGPLRPQGYLGYGADPVAGFHSHLCRHKIVYLER